MQNRTIIFTPAGYFSSDFYKKRTRLYFFGFNGHSLSRTCFGKKDDELYGSTGTSYNFKFRMYDSRIGRFNTTDPLFRKYPMLSPFQFASLNPIWKREIEGLEGSTTTGSQEKKDDQGNPTGTTTAIDATATANVPVPVVAPSTTLSPDGSTQQQQAPSANNPSYQGPYTLDFLSKIDNALQGNTYYTMKSGIAPYSQVFGTQNNENNFRADPYAKDVNYVDFSYLMSLKVSGKYSGGNNLGEGVLNFTKGIGSVNSAVNEFQNSKQPKIQKTTSETVEFTIMGVYSQYCSEPIKDTTVTIAAADSINKKSLVKNKIFRKTEWGN